MKRCVFDGRTQYSGYSQPVNIWIWAAAQIWIIIMIFISTHLSSKPFSNNLLVQIQILSSILMVIRIWKKEKTFLKLYFSGGAYLSWCSWAEWNGRGLKKLPFLVSFYSFMSFKTLDLDFTCYLSPWGAKVPPAPDPSLFGLRWTQEDFTFPECSWQGGRM